MKTTLIIPDDLIRELKKKTAETGRTLSDVVAETLRNGLARTHVRPKLRKLTTYRCGKIYVDVSDREQLYRAMEGN